MKVVVTGGAGFIGSHITNAYIEAGHEVIVIDDLSSGRKENLDPTAHLEQVDIRSGEAARLIELERPDAINHHAAQMNVRLSVEDPRFDADVNVVGFINILEAGRRGGCGRVVFASSGGTVYGEPTEIPCSEDQPTMPVCPYGISKLAGEHYLHYYATVYGTHCLALRYANVYGPRQDPHGEAGVVAIFCQRLLADGDVTIHGDGRQTRDYVYVADVVAANLAALTADFAGAVNIGTGIETNVVDLYAGIKELIEGAGSSVHGPAKDGEVRRSALDGSLAAGALGWKPAVGLVEGLRSTVDFFRTRS